MYTHPIRKSPKSFKLYLEWGVALALIVLVALVIYAALANRAAQTTTQPAAMVDTTTLGKLDNLDAHDRGPWKVQAMDNLDAHDRHPVKPPAMVIEPAAKSILEYLRAHRELP